jgi:hypothetical protein
MTAIRSLPDRTHRAYLLPISAFAIALMGLWAAGLTPVALTLLYLLATYHGVLSVSWSRDMFARHRAGELRDEEVTAGLRAGIRRVGWTSLLPAILFAATDPLSQEVWKTTGSIAILTTLALMVGPWLAKRGRTPGVAGLLLAHLALPLNTSGALSMAFWLGWVELFTSVLPTGAS